MKKILSASLIAAAAMAAPAYAQSDDQTGPYAHLRAGMIDSNNPSLGYIDEVGVEDSTTADGKLRTKAAATFGGELGYDFGAVRFGVELAYNRNKINALTINSFNGTAIDADDLEDILDAGFLDDDTLDALDVDGTTLRGPIAKLRQLAVMANLTYDIPVEGAVQPYVGAGIGGVSNRLTAFGEKDSDFKFAWQLRAGAAFMATETIAITADYTYRTVGKTTYSFDDVEAYKLNRTKSSLFQIGLRAGF